MNKFFISTLMLLALTITGPAFTMEGHAMDNMEKFGDLFHESSVDGYLLSYYLMDLRTPNREGTQNQAPKDMDKPHHIMVYIMDKARNPVLKAKVGFLIEGGSNTPQKAMAMAMSNGFGITADLRQKGSYTIVCKAVAGDKTLMDKFTYDMK